MMALQVDLSVVTLITSTLIMFRRNFLTRNPNIAAVLVFNDFFITYFGAEKNAIRAPGGH